MAEGGRGGEGEGRERREKATERSQQQGSFDSHFLVVVLRPLLSVESSSFSPLSLSDNGVCSLWPRKKRRGKSNRTLRCSFLTFRRRPLFSPLRYRHRRRPWRPHSSRQRRWCRAPPRPRRTSSSHPLRTLPQSSLNRPPNRLQRSPRPLLHLLPRSPCPSSLLSSLLHRSLNPLPTLLQIPPKLLHLPCAFQRGGMEGHGEGGGRGEEGDPEVAEDFGG